MSSEVRKQVGEAFGRGDIQTVMADLIMLGKLFCGEAMR
jgi:hypothetical protein